MASDTPRKIARLDILIPIYLLLFWYNLALAELQQFGFILKPVEDIHAR